MSSSKGRGNSYFELVRRLLGSLGILCSNGHYAYHAEIAKELKQRNEEIYSVVMHGVVLVTWHH